MKRKQQNNYFRTLVERCEWLSTQPERFPSLYKTIWRRVPSRRVRESYAAIMAEHCRTMDLESRRCGTPREDGSVFGLSEKHIAIQTNLGDPRQRSQRPNSKHWRGRRVVQRRIRELRQAGLLEWGRPEWVAAGKACNPRALIEKGPRAGTYALFPSVRAVTLNFVKAVELDERLPIEIDDLKRRRAAGQVAPIVNVFLRRARDRRIKAAWRARVATQRGQVTRANPIAALWARRQE